MKGSDLGQGSRLALFLGGKPGLPAQLTIPRSFLFGCTTQLMGSQFPDQGLTLDPGSENPKP